MEIKITGRGVEITGPLRDYVFEKTSKLEEFFSNIQKVEAVLEARDINNAEKRQVVEIRAWMAGLKMIQATEAGRDMYAAVDLAVEEAKRQIRRHKEKMVDEQRRKKGKFKEEAESLPDDLSPTGPVIVKAGSYARKVMGFKEAKEELRVLDQEFLAFRNADNNEANVVHRKQGDFELLRAEKDLTPEEAVNELNTSGNNLILFINRSSRVPSVIFRRKSGNFGLIEPEL